MPRHLLYPLEILHEGLSFVLRLKNHDLTIKHPEAVDICDIASLLFPWFPRIAFELTAIMLLLNNAMLVGFHVFTGAKSEHQ